MNFAVPQLSCILFSFFSTGIWSQVAGYSSTMGMSLGFLVMCASGRISFQYQNQLSNFSQEWNNAIKSNIPNQYIKKVEQIIKQIKKARKSPMSVTKAPLWRRALSSESELTKQQIFDILFVVKQIIGAILGIVMAFVGLTGTLALIAYAGVSYLLVYFYVMRVLQPEEDTIEAVDIFKEHFMMGFFAFLLPWIVTYNLINY